LDTDRDLRGYGRDDGDKQNRSAAFEHRVGDGVKLECPGKACVVEDTERTLDPVDVQPIDNAIILAFLQQSICFAR
jgi:hypothetical protein